MLDSTQRDNSRRPSFQPFNVKPQPRKGKGGAGTLYSSQARAAHEEARKANQKAEQERKDNAIRREQAKQHLANMRQRDGR